MSVRRMFVAVAAALVLAGCGSGDETPDAGGATTAPVASPASDGPASAAPTLSKKAKKVAATVAPEVVVPSTADDVSKAPQQQAVLTGWQGVTVQELRKIDPRLVANQQAALKKVRASCVAFESGMFETKAIALIQKKFSRAEFAVPEAMAQRIYQTLLQTACYVMNES